jgi:hypothetical protein
MRLELTPSYMSPTKKKVMAEQTEAAFQGWSLFMQPIPLLQGLHLAVAVAGGFEGAVVSALDDVCYYWESSVRVALKE